MSDLGNWLAPNEGKWTKEEEIYLLAHVPIYGLAHVARRLKKPLYVVTRKYKGLTSNVGA
ncbi:hypothetical protein JCM9140_3111 [Halalkalibacter wakoensis JCM 9140]|uniref:Uncharacterized protein n=1 Tax=Halalkalibacter wakoensis JCM 9140 TaxID=1236970 RepID=W4Q4K0_9BACI|nr:hypothetical protein JCM9140_3111 [Halalkalibacter wakoensis JCM 9140]